MIIRDVPPFRIGRLNVRRVPSSTVKYRVLHSGNWYGYLADQELPPDLLETHGKAIKVHTLEELDLERDAYRTRIASTPKSRLAYYEVQVDDMDTVL